jgi:hypothetical protein
MSSTILSEGIETIIKQILGFDGFMHKFCEIFKYVSMLVFHKRFQKTESEETKSFYEDRITPIPEPK